jgi:hypothetical protein
VGSVVQNVWEVSVSVVGETPKTIIEDRAGVAFVTITAGDQHIVVSTLQNVMSTPSNKRQHRNKGSERCVDEAFEAGFDAAVDKVFDYVLDKVVPGVCEKAFAAGVNAPLDHLMGPRECERKERKRVNK